MRRLAGPDGVVLVMDERVAETFTAPGDEIEQLMYGYSLMCCLPDGMAHPDSVGTGTVMRPDTLRGYAVAAGFGERGRAADRRTTSSASTGCGEASAGYGFGPVSGRRAAGCTTRRAVRSVGEAQASVTSERGQPARMAGQSASTTRSGQSAGSSPCARWWAYRLPISMPVDGVDVQVGRTAIRAGRRARMVAASRRRRGSTRRSRNRAIRAGRQVLLGEHRAHEREAVRPGDRGAEVPQLGDQVGADVLGLGQRILDRSARRPPVVARSCLPEKRR